MDKLRILEADETQSRQDILRKELQQQWERQQGAVYARGGIEADRKERIWRFVQQLDVAGRQVLEVGIGDIGQKLQNRGAQVLAIDAVEEALRTATVETRCEMLPHTSLPSKAFDVVLCTDTLAEVPKPQRRLAINELQRVLNQKGQLVCSTSLSLDTKGALERFMCLIETEFEVEDYEIAYHALALRLKLRRPVRWLERLLRQPSWVILRAKKKRVVEKRAGDTA